MPVLEGRGLGCHRGGRVVFRDLSFALGAAAALVVTGPNGSGKSSLLKVLAGLIRPSAGAVLYEGRPTDEDRPAYHRASAYLGHADALKLVLTVRENLAFWNRTEDPARLTRALESLGLAAFGDLPVRLLSAGQRRRLALARILISAAPVWILDEPAVGLDDGARRALAAVIAAHRADGGLLVLSTHQPMDLPGAQDLDLEDYAVYDLPEMVW
jgi:heme exporter protein A